MNETQQAVVMRGTPSTGWTIYGPFLDWDAAHAYAVEAIITPSDDGATIRVIVRVFGELVTDRTVTA